MNDISYTLGLIFQWIGLSKHIFFLKKDCHTSNIDLTPSLVANPIKTQITEGITKNKSHWHIESSTGKVEIADTTSSLIIKLRKVHQCISDIQNQVKILSGDITNVMLTKTKVGVANLKFHLKTG